MTIMASSTAIRPEREWNIGWTDVGPFVALIVLMLIGFLINPDFLSATNLGNVITRSAFIAIIAVGATFVISSGGLDLSVGSMAAFITGITIMFMNRMAPEWGIMAIPAGMTVAIVVGLFCGLMNGLIVTVGKIEPFIATLGTMGIFRALITYMSDGGTIPIHRSLRDAYRARLLRQPCRHPSPDHHLVGRRTDWGLYSLQDQIWPSMRGRWRQRGCGTLLRHFYHKTRTIAFAIQGICVAIAAICYVPRLGAATPTTGLLWELQVITAVVIGGTALRGGKGHVWGTIAGAVILEMIANLMVLSDFISEYLVAGVKG